VVPDAGMSCDVTSTNVRCSIAGGAQNFVPDSASPMYQAIRSPLFASRTFPMAMKIVAAAAGAMAFQVLGGLFASPARAAWGWFLDVPAGLGFSCSEGTSLGCATPAGCEDSNFSCTVVPDAGMSCDVTSTNVRCSIAGGAQNFVPDSASPMCAQVNTSSHYNNASLSWSPVPTCGTTTTGQTSTSDASMEMVGFVAAALASAQML